MPSPERQYAAFFLTHAGFFLAGIVGTCLGPLLPALTNHWQLSDAQAGSLFTMQAGGAMLGAAASGWLTPRYGYRQTLTGGYGLTALAIGAFSQGSLNAGRASIFVSGLALGVVYPATTLLVTELASRKRAQTLNILNLFWGLGAVAAPLLCAALTRSFGLKGALLLFAAATLFYNLLNTLFLPARVAPLTTPDDAGQTTAAAPWLMLIFGGAAFFYCGAETTAGGWLTTYAQRLANAGAISWTATMFWMGLLSGRAGAPLLLRRLSETGLIMLGLGVAATGQCLLLARPETPFITIGAGLTGLGLAPVLPTILALFTQKAGASANRLTGFFYVCTGLGAAFFPGLAGWLAARTGQLRFVLALPLLACLVIPWLLYFAPAAISSGSRQEQ